MSNIIRFTNFKNNTKPFPTNGIDEVYSLYHELIDSGFSSCVAYHEAMRLLLYCNPKLELSDLSQKTFEIINPVFDNYFENGIDNHSQNKFNKLLRGNVDDNLCM